MDQGGKRRFEAVHVAQGHEGLRSRLEPAEERDRHAGMEASSLANGGRAADHDYSFTLSSPMDMDTSTSATMARTI